MPAASTLYPAGWPAVGTTAFYQQAQELMEYRDAECPASRGTTYYLRYDSMSGGGAAGSAEDPFLATNLAELQALIDIYGPGNTILIKDDSVFAGTTGLTISSAMTIGKYGTSGGHWVVSAFDVDSGSGWTNTTYGAYVKTDTTQVQWVRLNEHPDASIEVGTETVFRKCGGEIIGISIHATGPTITTGTQDGSGNQTSGSEHGLVVGETVILYGTNSTPSLVGAFTVATVPTPLTFTVAGTTVGAGTAGTWMQQTNNGWAYNPTADILMVRIGANVNPASTIIQVAHGTGKGIYVNEAHTTRVTGGWALGWGMESLASGNFGLHAKLSGTKAAVFDNCRSHYGTQHNAGQILSSGSGGILLMKNCKAGLGRADANGEGTIFVSYSGTDGNEMIVWGCQATHGCLPDTTTGDAYNGVNGNHTAARWNVNDQKRFSPYYMHTGADGVSTFGTIGLCLIWNFRTLDDTYGCRTNGTIGNTVAYTTNRSKTDEYRAWIVGDRFDGGNKTTLFFSDVAVSRLWSIYTAKVPVGTAGNFFAITTQTKAAWIGVNVTVDWTNVVAGGTNRPWTSSLADMYFDAVYCTFRNINCGADYYPWDARSISAPYMGGKMRFLNSIWSTGAGSPSPAAINMCPNGAPTGVSSSADSALTGGGLANAYYNTGTSNPKTVYGPADYDGNYLGHSGHTGYVDLTGEASASSVPTNGDQRYQAANTSGLPFVVQWWRNPTTGIDYAMPALPSIGAIQQASELLTFDEDGRQFRSGRFGRMSRV